MAELILKVTPEEVKQKAQQITAQKSVMEGLMAEMQSKVTELQEYWRSTSGENFVAKYQSVSKNVQGSLDTLYKHIQNLSDAAASYEQLETEQAKKIEALSTENIF